MTASVGVLALQGDVVEHVHALERAALRQAQGDIRAVEVRTPADLARGDALVVPGGESTTVIRLLDRFGLADPIRSRVAAGMPLWGTCMGMIICARDVVPRPELVEGTLGLLDVTVRRNAFGRQIASAEAPLAIPALGPEPFPAIFIRAPWIERTGPGVETLAEHEGHGVMVRQGNVLGTSFHPELTGDPRVHRYFLEMVTQAREDGRSAA